MPEPAQPSQHPEPSQHPPQPQSPAATSAAGTPRPSSETPANASFVPAADPYDAGMAVRREVLSDAHVDRAEARKDEFTSDFQAMITRYAWGTIWTRPGLPRTTRSAITLTAMIASGYWEELEMHVRAALRNGMTPEEIKEVFLQCAIYCSVPAANVAFSIGQRVLREELGEDWAERS